MREIPLTLIPRQKFNIVLGGQNCTVKLYEINGHTYMDLHIDNTAVFYAVLCVNRVNIVPARYLPFRGGLYFLDSLYEDDPHYEEYNTRFVLLYLAENEEVPQGLLG